jgi:hypothetical protein
MIIPVALSLLAASSPATIPVAVPIRAAAVRGRRICVPARDAAGKVIGAVICRTAIEWESFLRDHGYIDSAPHPRQTADSFVAPDQLYRPRR